MAPVLAHARADVALIEHLAQAPIGRHALHEAGLMWGASRPAGWRELGPPSPRRHITIMRLAGLDAALRATRLLSGSTWAVVDDGPDGAFDVGVSASDWYRIIRCLTATRREATRILAAGDATERRRELARAAWRVAVLGWLKDVDVDALTVLVRDRALRALLPIAAAVLDLQPRGNDACLTIASRHNVLRLLEQTRM